MKNPGRLMLYVDPKWRRREVHSPLMNPWWGNPFEPESVIPKQIFDAYSFDASRYGITDKIGEADMVFAPYRHTWMVRNDPELLQECHGVARANSLPLLIDGATDVEYPVSLDNVHILRYGGYRFMPEHGRIEIPVYSDDLLERCRSGRLEIRKKLAGKPVIGFAGWAKMTRGQRVRTFLKELPIRLSGLLDYRHLARIKGVLWRIKAIGILRRSEKISLNLRERRSFSASPKTAEYDVLKMREEMVETILESDYALDVRGDANNSARLFEILSLGRIPIIVDTKRILSFGDKVDYRSFAIIVSFRDIGRLPDIVADFHRSVSPERFEEMQRNARAAFVDYFRIDAQMRHIVEELRRRGV